MTKTKGLSKDPRSGIYYLRRKIPEALRPAFACGDFYKVSLGTADPREAEKKCAIANGEYETKLVTFRAALANGSQHHLTPEEARLLVERDLMARSQSGFASGGASAAFILRELDEMAREMSGERLPTAQEMSPADWAASRRSISGSDDDDEFSDEALARLEAEHKARHASVGQFWFEYQHRTPSRRWLPLLKQPVAMLKRRLNLTEGDVPGLDEPLARALADALASPKVRQQLPLARSARRRSGPSRARPKMKLSMLAELWKAGREPTPKAVAAVATAVAYFTSYLGDIGIGEITSEDCFEFRDAVAVLPAAMRLEHRRLAFADQVAIYRAKTDIERIKPPSVKKYLGAIQALLGFAFGERFITRNVSARVKVIAYTKRSDRRPFTREEVAALFAAPLFTQPWSTTLTKSKVSDDTMRWLFLLALLTGARIEELGQVLLADVKKTDDVWYIDVTDYVAPEDGQEVKRVKTDSSIRVLPLHPRLVELGFLSRIEKHRSTGAVRLFPDLQADKLQVITKEASRRAARIIDEIVSKDRRLVFHSFRHLFKDLCRDAEIEKEVHDQLTGHAAIDQGGRYGLGRAVTKLYKNLCKLDLQMIDWAPILRAASA